MRRLRETYPGQRIAPALVVAPTPDVIRLPDGDVALPWDLAPMAAE